MRNHCAKQGSSWFWVLTRVSSCHFADLPPLYLSSHRCSEHLASNASYTEAFCAGVFLSKIRSTEWHFWEHRVGPGRPRPPWLWCPNRLEVGILSARSVGKWTESFSTGIGDSGWSWQTWNRRIVHRNCLECWGHQLLTRTLSMTTDCTAWAAQSLWVWLTWLNSWIACHSWPVPSHDRLIK